MKQTMQRCLILTHRYLGIPLGVVFVVWFASGVVMMYTGDMPRLTPERKLERLPSLDPERVALAPAAAARRAHLSPTPRRALLLTVLDRPAYRFDGVTVFADTGERLGEIGPEAAAAVASRFSGLPPAAVEHVRTLHEPDQWTLVEQRQLPLHQLRVADAAGTVLYVSPRTGEVVMETTRRSRALAWLGAIPHWFYFTALRTNQPLWSTVVVWTATLGCLLAVLGLVLGVTQFRWRRPRADPARPGRAGGRIPYGGWMRWHYVTGVVFGLVTLTWVFSGLLSMEPYAWTQARGLDVPPDALAGGRLDLARFPAVDPQAWARLAEGRAVKEIELLRIQDDPYYLIRTASGMGGEAHAAAAAPPLRRPPGSRRRPPGGEMPTRRARRPCGPCSSRPTRWRCVASPSARSRCWRGWRRRSRRRRSSPPSCSATTTPTTTPAAARRRCRCCASSSATRRRRGSTSIPRWAGWSPARTGSAASSAGSSTACTASTSPSGTTAGRCGTSGSSS